MWRKLSAAQKVAIVASAAVAAVWSVMWIAPSGDVPEANTPVTAPSVVPAQAAPEQSITTTPQPPQSARASVERERHTVRAAPANQQPPAAAPPVNDLALAAFRQGMASDNSETRIEALRQLQKDGTVEALPELLKTDLARDPEVAPTLIQVTSQLAQRSPLRERGAVAEQMSSWLKSESVREDDAARGNVSQLVESLSGLNSPKTQNALIEVLQNEKLPLHVQTLAVDGLGHFTNADAKAALEQFRDQLAQGKRGGSEVEQQQQEAQRATDRALARVTR